MKSEKNNFIAKCALLIVVVAIAVISLYYGVIDKKTEEAEGSYPKTTYEILAVKDFDISYPATPYELLKTYNKYLKYMYNSETSDDELEVLVDKIRCMWSDEWLELNERDMHVSNMRAEIDKFQEDGKVMSNYTVSDSSTVKEFTSKDGREGCTLVSSYLYTIKKSTSKVYMTYYFLKENGRWKILYYELTDESGNKIISREAE